MGLRQTYSTISNVLANYWHIYRSAVWRACTPTPVFLVILAIEGGSPNSIYLNSHKDVGYAVVTGATNQSGVSEKCHTSSVYTPSQ